MPCDTQYPRGGTHRDFGTATGSALNKNERKTDLDTCYIGIIIYLLFKSYFIFITPGCSSGEEDVEIIEVRMQ